MDGDPLVEHLWAELHDLERRVGRQEEKIDQRLQRLEDRALTQDSRASEHAAARDRFLRRYPILIWTVGMLVSLASLAITLLHTHS